MNPADEKMWSTLIHLSALVLGLWGPLIGYLVLRERGPFVRAHTATALNFHLSLLIYELVLIIPTLLTLGIAGLLYIPLGITAIVFMVIAAIAANRGEWYRYPLTIAFVS